jgi:threonyl-tRNA synthetase
LAERAPAAGLSGESRLPSFSVSPCGGNPVTGIITGRTCISLRSMSNTYAIKPMNCPGSVLLYKRRLQSYRDLPLRYCELGLVHRHELSGTLHGLMRVRCFHQDDAHIFMLPSQIQEEIEGVIDFIDYVYRMSSA